MKALSDIPNMMHAVVCYGPRDYRYETVPVPEITEDELLVKIKACGICAGDIKSYDGAAMFWGGGVLPPWNDAPVRPGHEFIGEVVAIGDNARKRWNLDIGDMAIAEQIVPCGECEFCVSGEYWMCERQNIYGQPEGYCGRRYGRVHEIWGTVGRSQGARQHPGPACRDDRTPFLFSSHCQSCRYRIQ